MVVVSGIHPSLRQTKWIALNGSHDFCRAAALDVMQWFGNHASNVKFVDGILRNRSESPTVRGNAAESLGVLLRFGRKSPKYRRTESTLIKALNDPNAEVRFWALYALGEMLSTRALPKIRRIAKDDKARVPKWWSVKREAQEVIERILDRTEL